jgi:hypothetical protein
VSEQRIPCPICGGELPVFKHHRGSPWTPRELWLIRRLKGIGLSSGDVGRLLGVSAQSVSNALDRDVRAP